MKLDFIARQAYYIEHLAPIWNGMPEGDRGAFFLSDACRPAAERWLQSSKLQTYVDAGYCGDNPILTAAYGDAVRAADSNLNRHVILMEHGIGLTYGKAEYADGLGQREKFSLFPVPNKHAAEKCHPELRHKPHPVIGVPKLDWVKNYNWAGDKIKRAGEEKVIAISFHHGNKESRPGVVGSAWEYYIDILPELRRRYHVIGHAHPMASGLMAEMYTRLEVEIVEDFNEVMKRADIYINDSSSTAYEFCTTGKPIVLLNAPWFDKNKNWGLRFWEYTDIGPQVDNPNMLIPAINLVMNEPDTHERYRRRMVEDLFPYLGRATDKALEEIYSFLKKAKDVRRTAPANTLIQSETAKTNPMPATDKLSSARRPNRTDTERGILYMCFGPSAVREMARSITSLRNVGSTLPVAIVAGTDTIPLVEASGIGSEILQGHEWQGENPYDATQAGNFQFRAGRVKPGLYDLSPFKETMYVDCDVIFMQDPEKGFGFLKGWDFVIAQERLSVGELYNQPLAGWEHNMKERDATIQAFGGDGNLPFWNSGVFFFRKNKVVKKLFELWSEEWNVWQNKGRYY